MSNDIRTYEPAEDWFDDAGELRLTAVAGMDEYGQSVQFTIGNGPDSEFICLTQKQVLDLMAVLSKRLACADNFSATAPLDEKRVRADGTKEVIEHSW